MSDLLLLFWRNEDYLTGLKTFLQALGSTLGDKEIMHLQDQFNAIDVDRNGAITFEEIREVKILIHLNVWGSAPNVSIEGSCCCVTFIDDYTRYTSACLIAKKSEFSTCFLKVKSLTEQETNRKIKCLRTDGGKDYFFDKFSSYL